MRLGIFARTFSRSTLGAPHWTSSLGNERGSRVPLVVRYQCSAAEEDTGSGPPVAPPPIQLNQVKLDALSEVLDAIVTHGLACDQFNLACAGVGPEERDVDPALFEAIGAAHRERGLTLAAISSTYNMIHPDPSVRFEGLARLRLLAENARVMGTTILTLCTGTLDPHDMWRRHPDNDSVSAWKTLVVELSEALQVAEESDVTLAFEPEIANIVNSASKARRLLDEVGSARLKVVMDPANLLTPETLPQQRAIVSDALEQLGPDLVLTHAKELGPDGHAANAAPGRGVLDFDSYLELLREAGFTGPLILHGLPEDQVAEGVSYLRARLGIEESA